VKQTTSRLLLQTKQILVSVFLLSLSLHLQAEEQTWKVNMKNSDIKEFITWISTVTGKSFVVDPRVKGKVTVISNTSLDIDATYELFLSVLRVHGYAAVPAGDVVKIIQQVLAKQSGNTMDFSSERASEELITRVIPVKNASAVELVKVIRPMIPQYSFISGLASPNVLIISDHASNILRLIDIVDRIDVADTSRLAIVQLKEAWVEDMVALLEKIAPEQIGKGAKGPNRVTVVASERTNSLVFKGESSTLEKMQALVEQLDQPATRTGTTQVIRLAHADATDMAELLKNLVTDTTKAPKAAGAQDDAVNIQADEGLNALVIRANPTSMAEIKSIVQQLDVRRLQVLIESAIVEVTINFEKQLGSELIVGDTSSSSLPLGITAPSGILASLLQSLAVDPTLTTAPPLGDAPLFAAGKTNADGINFALIIRALSLNSDVNLLSTPSIMTMDNQEAKIVIGQTVPFRTGSTVTGSQGANNPFTTISREDVGLTLTVTPHIHDGDLVRLEVSQEISEVDDLQNIGAEAAADIITNQRTLETTILADNGEVIVLGGLMRDKVTNSNTKVPLLGDIPFLGRLFRSTAEKYEKQNLLIFLRPTVLASKEDSAKINERKFTGVWEVVIEGVDPKEVIDGLFDGERP
tara:strand:+ start:1966 stop:3882 length:1917 start_codon:yes stop_codon:yes gene_type:complete